MGEREEDWKNMGSETSKSTRIDSLLSVWSWAIYVTSLSLCFFISKIDNKSTTLHIRKHYLFLCLAQRRNLKQVLIYNVAGTELGALLIVFLSFKKRLMFVKRMNESAF